MNLNKVAKEITLEEGGKVSVSIGQVKEIMRLLFRYIARQEDSAVLRLVHRFREQPRGRVRGCDRPWE